MTDSAFDAFKFIRASSCWITYDSSIGQINIDSDLELTSIYYANRITTTALAPQSCTSGSPTLLLNLYNPSAFSYTYYSYSYTPTTNQATIMIELRQDPSALYIDDISVIDSSNQQLISNGGFETGSLTSWQRGTVSGGSVSSGCANTGTYCYADGIVGQTDNIHQSFPTVVGSAVTVSFYLRNGSGDL
ncbi:unnamed protein product [Rotaria magnacalcarata]|uniref:Uncharacterized protein n=1 Tax=Rotaria magnacalcarata TaxID=392030 RepID=A0A820IH64_9BILA|nr:unnamed protein product [Rotaria magnacalcarata]CAF4266274.1 unnamed protein product [Rotaria magnacalcarata]CAF4310135.1 unnamed protein product [Rotaria magnacalcarata]